MDMEALMAQAQALQEKVAQAQDKLADTVVKGISENGSCIVTMSGKYDLLGLTIRPEALEQGAEKLSEIVFNAFKDAKSKADSVIDKVMGEATAGMPMPK